MDEEKYNAALRRFEYLIATKLEPGSDEHKEMFDLSVEVAEYEDEHYPVDKPSFFSVLTYVAQDVYGWRKPWRWIPDAIRIWR